MAQRKTRMEELADAFICLARRCGTLEEVVEVLTMQQLGHVQGPVGLVTSMGLGTFHAHLGVDGGLWFCAIPLH